MLETLDLEEYQNPPGWEKPPEIPTDVTGRTFHYLRNTKVKGPNTDIAYTKAHVDELQLCQDSIEHFANNYYHLVHQDHGLINVTLRPYQRECLDSFLNNRFNILKYPRQSGKSTTFAIYVCWFILFNMHKNVVILANKEKQSKEMLSRIMLAYENLPFWMQQSVKTWNKTKMELGNGCQVIASTTSSDSIRGDSISLLIVDELAFVPASIWHEFWESTYPTIASAKTSKIILVSTPKGMNHFYKMWKDAIDGVSRFNPVEVRWQDVPGYDEEFKEDTIANMGPRKWTQEFECMFLASSNSIIDSKNMEEMEFANPLRHERVPLYGQIRKLKEQFVHSVAIYEKPKKDHEYVIGVDPAKITEDSSGDSLAMQIMDITKLPFKQVATVVINDGIHYLEVPAFLAKCGYYYNEAHIFIENNDQVGLSIADSMSIDWEYENVFSEKAGVFGFRTTAKTKKMSCLAIKMLIETGKLKVRDTTTISQLSTYIKKGNSYEAETGYSDDAVAALIASMFFLQDRMGWEHKINLVTNVKGAQTLADIDPRLIREQKIVEDRKEAVEEDPMPFGLGTHSDDGGLMDVFSQSNVFGD